MSIKIFIFYIKVLIEIYSKQEYKNSLSNDHLKLKCYFCESEFLKEKKFIKSELKHKKGQCKFCSISCGVKFNHLKKGSQLIKTVKCNNCNNEFLKEWSQIKKTKGNYCSQACAAIYHNKNKKYGTRRSYFERYVEKQLNIIFPNIYFDYNKRNVIGSELDIYCEELNLAIEIDGITHFKPIYGEKKFKKIQLNDFKKKQKCLELDINLYNIDVSKHSYNKNIRHEFYFLKILKIIESHLTI